MGEGRGAALIRETAGPFPTGMGAPGLNGTVEMYMGIGIDSNMMWQNLARGLIISLRQELGPMIVYSVHRN